MKKLFLRMFILFVVFLLNSKPGYALVPSGNYLELSGGYIKTTVPSNSFSYTFDFSALLKPDSVSGKQIIFSIGDKTAQTPHYEVGINGGTLYADYYYDANSRRYIAIGNIQAGVWTQIEVYLKNHLEDLYINGVNVFHYSHEHPYNIKNLGPDVVLGSSYLEPFYQSNNFRGKIDNVVLNHEVNIPGGGGIFTQFINWHLDEARGQTVAYDASSYHHDGILVGGDSLIHFFGVLPSPTPTPTRAPVGLTPIRWTRPVLPTLSYPFPVNPSPTSVQPPSENPTPTVSSIRDFPRPTRFFSR